MSKAQNNPPAFPRTYPDGGHNGMSLRDWFAGQALMGCLAYSHLNDSWGDYHNNGTKADLAAWVYEFADAMLAEREKGKGQ